MKRTLLAVLGAIFVCFTAGAETSVRRSQVSAVPSSLSFAPNLGQTDASMLFVALSANYQMDLAPDQARFGFGRDKVTMTLLGANAKAPMHGVAPLQGKMNYFQKPERNSWRSNISTYSRVQTTGVYPGVDLDFYGNGRSLEYDFLVQAHADVSQIQLKFSGITPSTSETGDLLLNSGVYEFHLLKPVVYQLSRDGANREPVAATYQIGKDGAVGFFVGEYDHARELVIDPVLAYSEYLSSYASAVAVDTVGNTYTASGYYYNDYGSQVTKFDLNGNLVYTTIFGDGFLVVNGIAADGAGNVYIAGQAGYDAYIPAGANSYDAITPLNYGAFVAKLSADGESVPYASYLVGPDAGAGSYATGIAVDASGDMYVTGLEFGDSFPTTAGAYQPTGVFGAYQGFVAKFNPALSGTSSLSYSTILGNQIGSPLPDLSALYDIAVDAQGSAYVTGFSEIGFPVTNGAFQDSGANTSSGGVYVTKLNANGSGLVYSAFLGAGTGTSLAVDNLGEAFVTGIAGTPDFPTTPGAYQTIYSGGFVTKLDSTGGTELYSTFLGGPSSYIGTNVVPYRIVLTPGCPDSGAALIVCNAYVSGWTSTNDFPAINSIQGTASSSGSSAFVVEVSADGKSAPFSTYLSGPNSGIVSNFVDGYGKLPALGVDSTGNISVAANLNCCSFDFPATIAASSSLGLGFVARISPESGSFVAGSPSAIVFGNEPVGVSTSAYGTTAEAKLTNYGNVAVPITSVRTSSSVFSPTNKCGNSVPASGYCAINVDFTPSKAGAAAGTLTVNTSTKTPVAIGLSGTGVNQVVVDASSSSLAFPSEGVEVSSPVQTVTISNAGDEPTTLSFSISGPDFLESNNCPAQLAAHASCAVNVTFRPTQLGLRAASLQIQASGGSYQTIALSGTGILVGVISSLEASSSLVEFAPQTVSTASPAPQTISVMNNSSVPVTLLAITPSGDFTIAASTTTCTLPMDLYPDESCSVGINFAPTVAGARTGALTFTDTAYNSPQTVSLTGTGLASTQTIDFNPGASLVFPDQPTGTVGGSQTIYMENTGTSPIFVFRAAASAGYEITSDSCSGQSLAGTTEDGSGTYSLCQINVAFAPMTTGAIAGTVMFYDSAPGSPHTVVLSGRGITPTGTIVIDAPALDFPDQAVGSPGAYLYDGISNTGNTPVTITSYAVTGDFFTIANGCTPPYQVGGNSSCGPSVVFSPTQTGNRTGTLTIQSTAGVQQVTLSGNGVADTQALAAVPASALNFASTVVGANSYNYILVENNGTDPINIGTPTITGANAGDFVITSRACAPPSGTLYPNGSACASLQFTPSAMGTRSATLTMANRSWSLTGVGVNSPPLLSFAVAEGVSAPQPQGSTTYIYSDTTLYNYGTTSVALGNLAVTGSFLIEHGYDACSGQILSAGSSCSVTVQSAPPVTTQPISGPFSGTLTVPNSAGKALISLPLVGYELAPINTALLAATLITFAPQVVGTSATGGTTLIDTGNSSITPGNPIVTPASDFEIYSQCGSYLGPGLGSSDSSCTINVQFHPSLSGTRTGTLQVPITYQNGTSATLTATISGTGVAPKDSAIVTPTTGISPDAEVGGFNPKPIVAYLTNNGTTPLTVAPIVTVNVSTGYYFYDYSDFSVGDDGYGRLYGSDSCSNSQLQPGQSCAMTVAFSPLAPGIRTGSITFPVTFQDNTTASPVLNLSGNGIAAVYNAALSPANVQFASQLVGTTGNPERIYLTNTGNEPILFDYISLSDPADFTFGYDTCYYDSEAPGLLPNQTCYMDVMFSPASGNAGVRSGVLNIVESNTGYSPTVALTGIAVTSQNDIVLSQTSVLFQGQTDGTSSPNQTIYLVNQGTSPVAINSVVLAGTNAADFNLTSNCSGNYFSGACTIVVAFTPQTGAIGNRTATVTETDASASSPHIITLAGTAVPPGLGLLSLSPDLGSGQTRTFRAEYSDSKGVSDLSNVQLLFNTSSQIAHACNISYYPASNSMYLENDAGTGESAALTPGSSSSVSNSQCTLSGAGTSVAVSGNIITVNSAITFASSFTGLQEVYMSAASPSASTGFVQEGTWTP